LHPARRSRAKIGILHTESGLAGRECRRRDGAMDEAKTVLAIRGLRVERGRVAILKGIDWRVGRGEHWVILGANGSGKTTLLKALTGFISPTAGEFSALGQRYGASDWRTLRAK